MYLTEQLEDAYARKGNYAGAIEHLKALYENGYATRQTMENMAIVYQQMEKMDEAEAVLKQIIEEFPQDYRACKRLAFLEADRQQKLSNEMRNYHSMEEYYECAQSLYQKSGQGDKEMLTIGKLMFSAGIIVTVAEGEILKIMRRPVYNSFQCDKIKNDFCNGRSPKAL